MAKYTIGEMVWRLTGDTSAIKKSLHDSEKGVNKLTKVLKKAGGLIGGFFAVQKIVSFAKTTLQAYNKQEAAVAKLNAILKSTQGVAGLTSNELQKMAASLQAVTTYGDETIMEGQSLLLTFTKIGKDVFPEATEAMLDMSTVMGQDLKSSAIQIGKALNDPIQGVTALRRVGVQLTKQQENQIDQFMRLGNIAGAQKIILGELNTQMGGASRAAAETLSGKIQQLDNAFGDMQETLADLFVGEGFGVDIVGRLTDFVNNVSIGIRIIQFEFINLRSFLYKINYEMSQLPYPLGGNVEQRRKAHEQYVAILKEELAFRQKMAKVDKESGTKGGAKLPSGGGGGGVVTEELSGIDALLKEMSTGDYWDSYQDQIARSSQATKDWKKEWEELPISDKINGIVASMGSLNSAVQSLGGALSAYYDAVLNKQLERIDAQMEAELEAAGLAEETAVEKAEAELAAAQEAGDEEAIIEAEKALKKAKIEEKYQKRKAKAEYNASMRAWELQKKLAIAQGAMAVLNAVVSGMQAGWPLALAMVPLLTGMAAATAAIQYATVVESKPSPPRFATGGIVPGDRSRIDQTPALVTPGEMILNEQQQSNLLEMATQGGMTGDVYIYLGSSLIYKEMYRASKNGDLIIHAGAVTDK